MGRCGWDHHWWALACGAPLTAAEHAIVHEASALAVVTVAEGWRQFQSHVDESIRENDCCR